MKVDMLKKHVYFFRGIYLTGGENMGRHKGGKNRKGSFLIVGESVKLYWQVSTIERRDNARGLFGTLFKK